MNDQEASTVLWGFTDTAELELAQRLALDALCGDETPTIPKGCPQ